MSFRKKILLRAAFAPTVRLYGKTNYLKGNMEYTMKRLSQLLLLPLLILTLATGCQNEDDTRLSPVEETTLPGDAGQTEINLNRSDWKITSITTPGGTAMVGDDNRPLQLDGLGTLEFRWFTLTRDRGDHLSLSVTDNLDGDERGMVIHLAMNDGFYSETITILQQPCTTVYEVRSMTYTLEEGDGERESDWTIDRGQMVINAQVDGVMNLNPYLNATNFHDFKCDAKDAFTWLMPDVDYLVPVPDHISDGQLVFADPAEQIAYSRYTVTSPNPLQNSPMIDLAYKGGMKTTFTISILYKELTASYHLVVANPVSGEEREFSGKLVRKYPYKYVVEKEEEEIK